MVIASDCADTTGLADELQYRPDLLGSIPPTDNLRLLVTLDESALHQLGKVDVMHPDSQFCQFLTFEGNRALDAARSLRPIADEAHAERGDSIDGK